MIQGRFHHQQPLHRSRNGGHPTHQSKRKWIMECHQSHLRPPTYPVASNQQWENQRRLANLLPAHAEQRQRFHFICHSCGRISPHHAACIYRSIKNPWSPATRSYQAKHYARPSGQSTATVFSRIDEMVDMRRISASSFVDPSSTNDPLFMDPRSTNDPTSSRAEDSKSIDFSFLDLPPAGRSADSGCLPPKSLVAAPEATAPPLLHPSFFKSAAQMATAAPGLVVGAPVSRPPPGFRPKRKRLDLQTVEREFAKYKAPPVVDFPELMKMLDSDRTTSRYEHLWDDGQK